MDSKDKSKDIKQGFIKNREKEKTEIEGKGQEVPGHMVWYGCVRGNWLVSDGTDCCWYCSGYLG